MAHGRQEKGGMVVQGNQRFKEGSASDSPIVPGFVAQSREPWCRGGDNVFPGGIIGEPVAIPGIAINLYEDINGGMNPLVD